MSYRNFDLASIDAQTALTEFATDMARALASQPVPWARQFGISRQSSALRTRWPIPLSTANYKELNGDKRLRSLAFATAELIPKTWQDGFAELKTVVEAPDFFGWGEEPANMAAAATALPNTIIAGQLAAGETATGTEWDGVAFFSNAHPVNKFKSGFGTYDNLYASKPIGASSISDAKAHFRSLKGANGENLGLRMTHMLVPNALAEEAEEFVKRDLIIESNGSNDFGTVRNHHMGTVQVIVGSELTEDNYWYPLALNKPGLSPWVVQDQGAPETIILGEQSALYENEKKVGIESVLRGNGLLLMPQCIARYKTTA